VLSIPSAQAPNELKNLGYADAANGLAGLIVLGNAWESIDVYNALGQVLRIQQKFKLMPLIALRMKELSDQGKHSLFPDRAHVDGAIKSELENNYTVKPNELKAISELYSKLRQNADEWQKARTDFMLSRLSKGRHPDTDRNFWKGYKPVERLPESLINNVDQKARPPGYGFLLFAVFGVGGALSTTVIVLRRRFSPQGA
jgi:hypothetical protein